MISYVLPTRDRHEGLVRTLAGLGSLPPHEAEVIVVDNASTKPVSAPGTLDNGVFVRVIRRETNEGAAARNAGAAATDSASEWVVMLDDDSRPLSIDFLHALREAPDDVAAIAAEIFLPPAQRDEAEGAPRPPIDAHRRSGFAVLTGTSASAAPLDAATGSRLFHPPRESGGLPEVFIGCGVAIRRAAFLDAGGYDPSFNYYAEEYDLAARFLLAQRRITLDRRFKVLHEKSRVGRNMDTILRRLVRNNGWVMARYAPEGRAVREIGEIVRRYKRIAVKEGATLGYGIGRIELAATLRSQSRTPMPLPLFDRFTGKAEARHSLQIAWQTRRFASACPVDPGKNEHVIREVLMEMGVEVVADPLAAEALVISSLSPGPILDALDRWKADALAERVVSPWATLSAPDQPASVRAA